VTTPTDQLPPFETRLLAELTDVVEDRRRAAASERVVRPRRTRYAVVTAGVAAIAVALAVAPGLTRDGGQRAFALRELPNGVLEVSYDRDLRDGRALEEELRSHGVDVGVRLVPSSPSAVGAIYGLEAPEQGTEPGFAWGPDGGEVAFVIDPELFRGEVTLHLSVAAAPGEPYELREEVFEPGEVLGGLHCALGEPIRADQLVPYLDELDLGVLWETIGPDPDGDPGVAVSEAIDDVPAGEVMWGYALDTDTVEVTVRADGVELDPEHWPTRLSDVPCTPEQAAAWD
jgi:hypothetical protein